jgi:DNA-3-methyladenine glycosylase II
MARAFLSGDVVASELAALPPDEAIRRLTRLRGIGAWTAECTLMFGAAERDLLPADDLGIQQGARMLYGLDHVPGAAELRVMGERWAGWRSYAAVYLWTGKRHGLLGAAGIAEGSGRDPGVAGS